MSGEREMSADEDMEKKSPIVTVVVSSYNEEQFVPEALEYLAESTFRESMELLVIDDCSPNGIKRVEEALHTVAPKFATARLVRIRKNSGLAATRNLGLDLARGKYVSFHDGDDFWLDNWERGAQLLDEHPDWIGLGTCGQRVTQTRPLFYRLLQKFGFSMKTPPWGGFPMSKDGDQWVTWMIRLPSPVRYRRVFSRPLLHPELSLGLEDVVFWYERLMHGKVGTDGCNLVYRCRTGGRWFRGEGARFELMVALAPFLTTEEGLAGVEAAVQRAGFDLEKVRRLAAMTEEEFGPVEYDTVVDTDLPPPPPPPEPEPELEPEKPDLEVPQQEELPPPLDPATPEQLDSWTPAEVARDFEVLGTSGPYVRLRRRKDGAEGTMRFNSTQFCSWRQS
jgi:hypothetical protein